MAALHVLLSQARAARYASLIQRKRSRAPAQPGVSFRLKGLSFRRRWNGVNLECACQQLRLLGSKALLALNHHRQLRCRIGNSHSVRPTATGSFTFTGLYCARPRVSGKTRAHEQSPLKCCQGGITLSEARFAGSASSANHKATDPR